jgi:hypothetical protein
VHWQYGHWSVEVAPNRGGEGMVWYGKRHRARERTALRRGDDGGVSV